MGQVTLYLPQEIEKAVKKEAKKNHKSISAYVSEILSQKVSPKKWSSAFLKVCGTWEEEFVEASELQNTKRDDLE
ncbi:MAG: hypothetical protein A2504_04610 [Bdellovibrionales bacterium RIFOXYD12_FULL_39_22]|nr:MAG: hypothetical protein A2385_07215 [Bdellovibrionales bacterium RIFOXYB1_FULL_39_21]OFZ42051.1 MAG: hypothetical protein A2485_09185 [Bdellovibrionales bacterium RIFOXYC12_FULL_39_17]OFZ50767.1 MAG: hypothetical protein A2404_06135 [Bdellovibrionales bacterium RIFOXYC1_FULL_39_130]OFZ73501.1 MAG: hypothetical protein A2451_04770 [Bdellovibrionales bacterium RIFOXYC2_FULL_39_8]OFZ77990.1 MAG: hypothetical protein A2560_01305 [Bdellovibrionales bacterium RIFOXYD1_FULL_39_84]OFZ93574.1 MAG: